MTSHLASRRQPGFNLQFQEPWQVEAMAAAAKLVPNQAFKGIAMSMAASHPHALDYLVQAPVLVLAAAFGRKDHPWSARSYIAGGFSAKLKRGLKLRDLMAEYRVAYGFRALRGSVLCPSRALPIFSLSLCRDLHPSALAQAIPASAGHQTRWLQGLCGWCKKMVRRQRSYSLGLPWAATAAGAAVKSGTLAMDDLADFYMADPACFNPKWTYDQAKAASDRWHRHLARKEGEAEFFRRHGLGLSEPIDYGDLPLEAEVGGYRFVALDSGEELFAEGAAMHHCVGSYSADVIAGRARIYSVRSGERRVATLELRDDRGRRWTAAQLKGPCNAPVLKVVRDAALDFTISVRRGIGAAA